MTGTAFRRRKLNSAVLMPLTSGLRQKSFEPVMTGEVPVRGRVSRVSDEEWLLPGRFRSPPNHHGVRASSRGPDQGATVSSSFAPRDSPSSDRWELSSRKVEAELTLRDECLGAGASELAMFAI
jgi:hypothetical protein